MTNFLLKFVDETIKREQEDLLTKFLLPKAQKATIGSIFTSALSIVFYSLLINNATESNDSL